MIFGVDYAVINEYVEDYSALKPFLDFQFALYRLTQGYNIYDNVYVVRGEAQKAHSVGMLTGAWHQFDPTQSVIIQMDNFTRSWDSVKDIDLRPILAVESGARPDWAAVPARVQADMLEQSCEILKARIADPIMYTREEYWDNHIEQRPRWSTLPIWLAHYITINSKQAPTLLAPPSIGRLRDWPNVSKWMWQYTDKGLFPGIVVAPNNHSINANIDLNAFNGTRADLERWTISTVPVPTPDNELEERVTNVENALSEYDKALQAVTERLAEVAANHNNFVIYHAQKESEVAQWISNYPKE